jgi:hypothetical protein
MISSLAVTFSFEESNSVSLSLRVSGFMHRSALVVLALGTLTSVVASAQTAPQLLPSTTKLVAGGGTTTPAKGGLCPNSGYMATDAYGDGCLATEVLLGTATATPGARAAVADALGNVYFGDYVNGVVHRVDVQTGILSAVAGSQTASPGTGTSGATCGGTSTDAKGDGCLGYLVHLSHPTGLTFSPAGDLYIADYGYGEVRKVALSSQVVTAVALVGGGSGYTTTPTVTFSAPPTGGTTATATATMSGGVVTGITLVTPGSGYTSTPNITFSAAPTGGTTATGYATSDGVITLSAGSPAGTFGYNISNATTTVTAAQSVLDGPYGVAFDNKGNLFIEDEYTAAVLVVNTNATGTETINNTVVPAGTIWKIAGTVTGTGTSGAPYCTNGTGSGSGCTYNYASYTEGIQANTDWLRNAFGLAVDPTGNVFITHEYLDTIVKVAPSGILTTAVGKQGTAGHALTRGVAPNIAIGSPFGVAADSYSNLYFTDAADGTIWRVDANTNNQFLIAQGFGTSGTGFASTTLPGPGIYHISVDPYADLFFGDTEKNNVSEVASGTQFGVVGAVQVTDNVVIHFGVGDMPASTTPYVLTAGATNFVLGTPTLLASNTDGTSDYTLPITATPTVLGRFTGNLQVASQLGGVSNFLLSGYYLQSPVTRTTLKHTAAATCSGTTFSTTTPITLTATVISNGPLPPTAANDTVTFFQTVGTTTTQIGSPVQVSNLGTTSAPVYGAILTTTFPTVATYTFTAVFSGDAYYKTSTGKDATTLTTSVPVFSIAPVAGMQSSVIPGQTALYSFTIAQNVYAGTIGFVVTGLPAYSTYAVTPVTITGTGCSASNTVALSIFTQVAQTTVKTGGFGGTGHGPWQLIAMFTGLGLALLVGLRRRSLSAGFARLGMALALLLITSGTVACSSGLNLVNTPATPIGSYTITVTPTTTVGTAPAAITFPLVVHN